MGKPGKWLKNFLTGKKDKGGDKEVGVKDEGKATNAGLGGSPVTAENPTTPVVLRPTTPREKRRWSFRRLSANSSMPAVVQPGVSDPEDDQRKHAMAVAAATAAAADAAAAAAQAAAAMMMLTAAVNGRSNAIEEAAAVRIQSAFRSYLARKALRALRGLVKLQALVRGHLVRKQAKATLRCMQALVTVQARARAQRLRMATEDTKPATVHPRSSTHRKSTQDSKFRNLYQEIDRGMMEENIKIVEMDLGEPKPSTKSRNSYSYPNQPQPERMDHRFSMHYPPPRACFSQDNYQQVSLAPSALTEMSPRTCSGHFEDYAFCTTQSSPQCYSAMSKLNPTQIPFAFPRPDYSESQSYDYPLYPNYMANTESSRAKARSQSAPKQRPPDYFERPASRRRPSIEGRGIPRGSARMQRSSSHVGSAIQGYQYPPWSVKQLDRSMVSLVGRECGSTTSTMMTNTNYCKYLVEDTFDQNSPM